MPHSLCVRIDKLVYQGHLTVNDGERIRNALTKQTAKKPKIVTKYGEFQCCNGHNIPCICRNNQMPYCPFCGQAIDWSDI